MTRTTVVTGLVGLAVVMACTAVTIGTVVGVRWLLDRVWPVAGVHTQLFFALIAPFGVVLFAVLVEKLGQLTDHLA